MISVELPLLALSEGALLIPAENVTALLRDIAGEYRSWGRADHSEAQAVADAAHVLDRLADQIDVECIAVTDDSA
ncbi:hypothetical protein [Streptacidiphilus neutrinimicus]|uniref:hypothetical protein n=1 Tax=Streptacidiphilus neutrinimicus TaxID=105420 RepID=UPI0005A71A25|nr:hypothetical protein [Streptacidiphilus neutrinimicus]